MQTRVGPVLLLLNPFQQVTNTRFLDQPVPEHLQNVVRSTVQQIQDMRCSQSLVIKWAQQCSFNTDNLFFFAI